MRQNILSRLRRWRDDEEGTSTIEFVMVFPAFIALMVFCVELAFMSLNHAMLERALDQTVRDVRLGTGSEMQAADIKDTICDRAFFVRDCSENLGLEMIQLDPFGGFTTDTFQYDLLGSHICEDLPLDVNPVRSFTNGQSNDLMVMRACVDINPIFPAGFLGATLSNEETGQYSLFATTAFVQEPR